MPIAAVTCVPDGVVEQQVRVLDVRVGAQKYALARCPHILEPTAKTGSLVYEAFGLVYDWREVPPSAGWGSTRNQKNQNHNQPATQRGAT